MGCLDNLIALDGSCAAGTGRVYLKSIGIHESELVQYLAQEEQDVPEMLSNIAPAATAQLQTDVMASIAGRIMPKTFIDRDRIGQPNHNREAISATASTDHGLVVDVFAPRSNIKIQISELAVWSQSTGTVTLTLRDVTDGKVLGTETISAVAGQVTRKDVDIVLQGLRRRTRVLITSDMAGWYKCDTHEGCGPCTGGVYSHGVLTAYGASIGQATTLTYSNLARSGETGGISAVVTVVCDHTAYLCEVKEALAMPLLYLQGAMLMQRGLDNVERMNTRTINAEVLQDRLARYLSQYRAALEQLVGNMPLPNDDMCYVCNRQSRVAVVVP